MRVTLLLYRWEFNWLVAESGSMALRAAPEDMYQSAIHPLFLFKPHFLMAPTSTLFKSAIMEIRRALSHGWVSPFVADLDPYLQCCISARASLRLRGRAASLKRCHWYKQLLVTAGSSYLPWRFFWLDVSNTTLFSAVYSNLDSLGSIFSRLCLQLVRRLVVLNLTSEAYHILSPYAESSVIIDLNVKVSISWCYVVARPDLPQSAFKGPIVLSLAQYTVPKYFLLMYQVW